MKIGARDDNHLNHSIFRSIELSFQFSILIMRGWKKKLHSIHSLWHNFKKKDWYIVGWQHNTYSSVMGGDCLWVGLTLPPRLILSASSAFCISIVMALSTLPDDIFLCAFCKWSFKELLLSPAFFPQIGQTFIIGLRCCHSIETFPCNFWSKSKRIRAKPSLGWALRWARFRAFHACNRVKFLH